MADVSKSISVSIDVQNNATSALQSISAVAQQTGSTFDSLSASLNEFIATEGGAKSSTDDLTKSLQQNKSDTTSSSTGYFGLTGSIFLAEEAVRAFNTILSELKQTVSDSIEAGLQYSGTLAILQQNITNAGLSYTKLTPQITAYAKAQVDLGFTQNDTTQSLGKLLLITGSYSDAVKLNGLAMDLASNKGISLTQSTQYLAQILQGQGGRALAQYGLTFKDGASSAEILNELQQKVANSANALAGSPQGAVNKMAAQWNQLETQLGTDLLPTIQKIVDAFENNLPAIETDVTKVANALIEMVEVVTKAIPVVEDLVAGWVAYAVVTKTIAGYTALQGAIMGITGVAVTSTADVGALIMTLQGLEVTAGLAGGAIVAAMAIAGMAIYNSAQQLKAINADVTASVAQGTATAQQLADAYNKVHNTTLSASSFGADTATKKGGIFGIGSHEEVTTQVLDMKMLQEAAHDFHAQQGTGTTGGGSTPPVVPNFDGMGSAGTNAKDALSAMQKQVQALGDSITSVDQKSVKFGFDGTSSFQDFIAIIGSTKLSNDDFIKEAEAGFSALSTKIQATQTDITTLTGKISDAQKTFADFVTSTNSSTGDSMAKIVNDAANAIPGLQKQISTATPGSDTSDLQKQLADKQKIVAQSKTAEFTSNQEFVKELAYLTAENGKTELEQALDDSKQKIANKLDETEQIIAQYSIQIQADQKAHDMYVKFQVDATKVLSDNVNARESSLKKEGTNNAVLKKSVDDLVTSYNNLADAMRKSSGSTSTLFGNIPVGSPHASGGPVSGNTAYLVGEKGPEMFVPNGSGNIVPNNQLGGGGSVTININNPTVRNDSDIKAIVDATMKALSRNQELAKYRAYK